MLSATSRAAPRVLPTLYRTTANSTRRARALLSATSVRPAVSAGTTVSHAAPFAVGSNRATILPDNSRRLDQHTERPRFVPGAAMDSETEEVVLDRIGDARSPILNRKKALNALNLNMVRRLTQLFEVWGKAEDVHLVVLQGAGEKAFCAGGDIVALYKSGLAKDGWTTDFFREEYQLDHMIATSPCVTVAVMDGITMGGGVGLTINSDLRIVTERTVFAMPETGIGFFPDVGGSYFMPRIAKPGVGIFLSLTGHRLKGEDVVRAGVGTHFVKSERLDELFNLLGDCPPEADVGYLNGLLEIVAEENLTSQDALEPHYAAIERCFSGHKTIEGIFGALEAEGTEWADKQLKILRRMSPTSLKVTLEQMLKGASKSLEECFVMEFRMAQHFMENKDFFEGVRAVLVDRDNTPQWSPSTIDDVTDEMVKSYFEPVKGRSDLELHRKIEKDKDELWTPPNQAKWVDSCVQGAFERVEREQARKDLLHEFYRTVKKRKAENWWALREILHQRDLELEERRKQVAAFKEADGKDDKA